MQKLHDRHQFGAQAINDVIHKDYLADDTPRPAINSKKTLPEQHKSL
jgi:hypothetical protein